MEALCHSRSRFLDWADSFRTTAVRQPVNDGIVFLFVMKRPTGIADPGKIPPA